MNKLITILTFFTLISCYQVNAQKVKLLDGSLDVLEGVDKINLQYEYSDTG